MLVSFVYSINKCLRRVVTLQRVYREPCWYKRLFVPCNGTDVCLFVPNKASVVLWRLEPGRLNFLLVSFTRSFSILSNWWDKFQDGCLENSFRRKFDSSLFWRSIIFFLFLFFFFLRGGGLFIKKKGISNRNLEIFCQSDFLILDLPGRFKLQIQKFLFRNKTNK